MEMSLSFSKHLTSIIGIVFAIAIFYYNYYENYNKAENYGYDYRYNHAPNLEQYRSANEKQQAFSKFLTPYIKVQNNIFKKLRNKVIFLHQQFLRTQHLTIKQIDFLNDLHNISTPFNPYRDSTWKELASKENIVPPSVLQSTIKNNFGRKKVRPIIFNNKNPLLLYGYPHQCILSKLILNNNQPWVQESWCYVNVRLSLMINKNLTHLPYMRYGSFKDAFADFIWTVNTNPAYREFRAWRSEHSPTKPPTEKNENKLARLLNPERIYNAKYYHVQT